jgi:hypothetical protein
MIAWLKRLFRSERGPNSPATKDDVAECLAALKSLNDAIKRARLEGF